MPTQRAAIVIGESSASLAGVGVAQVGAKQIVAHVNSLNSLIGATAYILPRNNPPGVPVILHCLAASTASALIFPPLQTGALTINQGKINALTELTAFTLAAGERALFYPIPDGLGINWIAIKSA